MHGKAGTRFSDAFSRAIPHVRWLKSLTVHVGALPDHPNHFLRHAHGTSSSVTLTLPSRLLISVFTVTFTRVISDALAMG